MYLILLTLTYLFYKYPWNQEKQKICPSGTFHSGNRRISNISSLYWHNGRGRAWVVALRLSKSYLCLSSCIEVHCYCAQVRMQREHGQIQPSEFKYSSTPIDLIIPWAREIGNMFLWEVSELKQTYFQHKNSLRDNNKMFSGVSLGSLGFWIVSLGVSGTVRAQFMFEPLHRNALLLCASANSTGRVCPTRSWESKNPLYLKFPTCSLQT